MSGAFLAVVLAVVVAPGVDLVMTLRHTVLGGRGSGALAALGIGTASVTQGALVSVGLGTLIVQSQPVFQTLRWLGIAYLLLLAAQALRSAWRGSPAGGAPAPDGGDHRGRRAFGQGFLANITNPKMFVFYLSLLPQFVGVDAPVHVWLGHALVLPLLGTTWLLVVAVLGGALREKLLRPVVRRVTDAVSGLALLGLGVRLAVQD